jgi:hypothetical protein
MALVVKHTFLEYRPASATIDEGCTHDLNSCKEYDFEFRGARRTRAFSDSEIDYSKSGSLYSNDGVESCETESTCMDTASLSDAVGSTSSASSSGGDCPELESATDFSNLPEFTSSEERSSSWEFAETVCGMGYPESDEQQTQEEQQIKARIWELDSQAAEFKAMALQAEEAAHQLCMEAYAPWCQISVDASIPMIAVPVQMMQFVPMSYVTEAVSDTMNSEAIPVTAASQQDCRKNKSKSANTTTARTTLMMRNVPNSYTRDMVLHLLDREGFAARYDFVYLPVDFRRLAGLGYVFVNFVTTEDAAWAKLHFQGFDRWEVASPKVCEMSWSEPLQGLDAHIDRYRTSPVMHEDVPEKYKPVYLQDGVRQPFPAPTKRIRPPRVKRGGVPGVLPDFSKASAA